MADRNGQRGPDRSLSVLVVEDEFLIAMDLKAILEDKGHTVVGPFLSVEAVLPILDKERPDVALLDVNLRGRLVTPVAERLRSLGIPFVLCSARTSSDFDGIQILMDANYIDKPFDKNRIIEALQHAVASTGSRCS